MSQNDIEQRSDKIKTYFPVLIFIVLIFLLEALQIEKATALLVSVLVSLVSLGVLIVKIHRKTGDLLGLRSVIFIFGILTFIFILIIGITIMHWYQEGHLNLRWGLTFLAIMVYLIILFRALHLLKDIRKKVDIKR